MSDVTRLWPDLPRTASPVTSARPSTALGRAVTGSAAHSLVRRPPRLPPPPRLRFVAHSSAGLKMAHGMPRPPALLLHADRRDHPSPRHQSWRCGVVAVGSGDCRCRTPGLPHRSRAEAAPRTRRPVSSVRSYSLRCAARSWSFLAHGRIRAISLSSRCTYGGFRVGIVRSTLCRCAAGSIASQQAG